ncbi:class I SAM-dependent methyltransferase [Calidifontibacillus erzurumensis]|nr:SAM-dependent methyltransferase [Calidifontibacillus erzurumensis]
MLNKLKHVIENSKNGNISYSEYMGIVLYDKELGYYMKHKQKIGKEGDFYTNSNVHSVFGKVLARIFIRLVQLKKIHPVICEIGAGTGRLANFILEEWKKVDPDSFKQLKYIIVEISPYHREEQRKVIRSFEKVQQFSSLTEMVNHLGKFNGIILANELFDAFPVDVVQKVNGEMVEVRITFENNQLVETFVPCKNEEIFNWLEQNGIVLTNGQRMEIPLNMDHWLEETNAWLEKGIMFTIDYGYTKEEWMHPIHREGSLRGYYKHQIIKNPLSYPGDMDLTTHIHLDALIQKGEQVGLKLLGMLNQREFLLKGGILNYLQENSDPNPFSEISRQNRAIRSLIMDDGISSSFTVLIQSKNADQIILSDILVDDY